jgi:hypothetical protein
MKLPGTVGIPPPYRSRKRPVFWNPAPGYFHSPNHPHFGYRTHVIVTAIWRHRLQQSPMNLPATPHARYSSTIPMMKAILMRRGVGSSAEYQKIKTGQRQCIRTEDRRYFFIQVLFFAVILHQFEQKSDSSVKVIAYIRAEVLQ